MENMGEKAHLPTSKRGRMSTKTNRNKMADLLRVARDRFIRDGYRSTTMTSIAAAVGVTKPTLYSWHIDKASLFRACLIDEAERFPVPDIDSTMAPAIALERYAFDLLQEFSSREVYEVGLCYLRDRHDFPALTEFVSRVNEQYLAQPLSDYFQSLGMQRVGAEEYSHFFVTIALAPLHHSLILDAPAPTDEESRLYARKVIIAFLAACPLPE